MAGAKNVIDMRPGKGFTTSQSNELGKDRGLDKGSVCGFRDPKKELDNQA
jgi:hypothetical protein